MPPVPQETSSKSLHLTQKLAQLDQKPHKSLDTVLQDQLYHVLNKFE